jgi:hypothetical protein
VPGLPDGQCAYRPRAELPRRRLNPYAAPDATPGLAHGDGRLDHGLPMRYGPVMKLSALRRVVPGALMFVGGMLVGALAAWGGLRALPELGFSTAQTVATVVLVLLMYLLCIAAHELGHVLGGRLGGFRLLLFIAGPFRLERTPTGFRAGLNRSIMLAGGLAAMTPVGLRHLRQRTLLMVAGGPVLSLMVAAQFLALYQAMSPALFSAGAAFPAQLAGILLLAIGLGSMLIGVVTLIPGRAGGFYSDGARMLRLMRTGDDTEREVALIALTGISMAGTRPRDWDADLVARGAGIRDSGPFEVLGRQLAYAHALDRGDVAAARAHLEAALVHMNQLPKGARGSLLLAAATFFALHDGDAERARAFLSQSRHGLLAAPHQRQVAQAAVRLAAGDVEGARSAAAEVQRLAATAIDQGGATLDVALAGQILAE